MVSYRWCALFSSVHFVLSVHFASSVQLLHPCTLSHPCSFFHPYTFFYPCTLFLSCTSFLPYSLFLPCTLFHPSFTSSVLVQALPTARFGLGVFDLGTCAAWMGSYRRFGIACLFRLEGVKVSICTVIPLQSRRTITITGYDYLSEPTGERQPTTGVPRSRTRWAEGVLH
jgi:hypothetical protein